MDNRMRMKMLISGLRHELSRDGIIRVESIRLVGTEIEVTYRVNLNHGIKIHEGYISGDIIEILTCKDIDFKTKMNKFIDEYKNTVRDHVKNSTMNKVGLWW